MSLTDAMTAAWAAVGIEPPRRTRVGQWVQTPVIGTPTHRGLSSLGIEAAHLMICLSARAVRTRFLATRVTKH